MRSRLKTKECKLCLPPLLESRENNSTRFERKEARYIYWYKWNPSIWGFRYEGVQVGREPKTSPHAQSLGLSGHVHVSECPCDGTIQNNIVALIHD